MSEKKLQCSRYIENFNPPYLIEELVHKVCESVADAFLGQIEYGKDYVISTELVKDDWADGFGTKYTYNLEFDELVRCMDCKHYGLGRRCDWSWRFVKPDGFCAWGERADFITCKCGESIELGDREYAVCPSCGRTVRE